MGYRLGLDLGTNSMGWALWTLEDKEGILVPSSVLDLGVRIFSDGRIPKTGDPLAVERRLARSMRRRRDRQLERRRKIVAILVASGLFPSDIEERRALKSLDPYELRAKALDQRLTSNELGRVLYHLSVRRGFLSNRKDRKEAAEVEGNLAKIQGLWQRMQESGARTLGEFLWRFGIPTMIGRKKLSEQTPRRFRAGTETYPERKMYEEEFDAIRKRQESFFPTLPWIKIRHQLFFQRPLKPVERGHCTFFPSEFRAWTALPSSQKFRYLQIATNLKVLTENNEIRPLNPMQLKEAIAVFETTAKVTTKTLRKKLKLAGSDSFNYQTRRNPSTGQLEDVEFKGNETAVRLRNEKALGIVYDSLSSDQQDTLVSLLIESEDQESFDQGLREKLPQLSALSFDRLSSMVPEGTLSVSTRFAIDCNRWMEEGIAYHEAAKRIAGHHSDLDKPEHLMPKLPYYGEVLRGAVMGAKPDQFDREKAPEGYYGKINNPTVHIALNQVRKVVNTLIERHGPPTQIVLELARELPMGQKQKSELVFEQNRNRKENETITGQINEALGFDRSLKRPLADIRKHKLWIELSPQNPLDRGCPYCGEKINASEAYGPATEIEHILPFSRTMLDGMSNLTIAHKRCNLAKGNRSPYEAFGHNPPGYLWDSILNRVAKLPYNKRIKFQPSAMEDFDKESGFIERQLNDTRYMSKAAKQYLGTVCSANNIWSVNGRLTADLRYAWGLNSIVGKDNSTKERSDHRHHALDALVLGLVDRRTVRMAAMANQGKGSDSLRVPFEFPIPHHALVDRFQSVLTSHKPDHGFNGGFFLDTAYGEIQVVEFRSFEELKKQPGLWARVVSPKVRQALETGRPSADSAPVAVKATRWVSRTAVEGLANEKDLGSLVDPLIREALRKKLVGLVENSSEWKRVLAEFQQDTGIRHLRYFPKNQEFTRLPKRGKVREYKGYQVDDYLCAEVWFVPQHRDRNGRKQRGGYVARFVTRFEAMLHTKESLIERKNGELPFLGRPHPAAKFICQLYKNDIISFRFTNADADVASPSQRQLGKVFGFSTTDNKLDVRALNASDDLEKWIQNTNRNLLVSGWKPKKGQNFVSINVIFGDLSGKKEWISPDSKLNCR